MSVEFDTTELDEITKDLLSLASVNPETRENLPDRIFTMKSCIKVDS